MYYHKRIFLYSLYLPNFRFTLIPWYPSLSSSLFPLTSPLKKQNSLLKIPDEFPLVSFKPKDSSEILKLTLVFHKFLSTVLDIHFSLLHFPASVLHSPGTTFCLLSRGQHGFADFGGWAAFWVCFPVWGFYLVWGFFEGHWILFSCCCSFFNAGLHLVC